VSAAAPGARPYRVLIVEYDDGDAISTTGSDVLGLSTLDRDLATTVTDDKTRHLISAGTAVDEFTPAEIPSLAGRFDTTSILAAHGL
jgi:hypothetical protein